MPQFLRALTAKLALAAGVAALALPSASFAVLQRQGPVDPATGFPLWYQDRNGIALELCTINHPDPVVSGLLVNAGLCAIFNAPAPDGIQNGPEVFPTNFVAEHFYTLASARIPTAGTRIAVTTVPAGGAWSFNATALQTRPATVYVYSPTYGGCTDATVQ